jgi:putative ABC transport system substrate-binding protein
MVIFMFNKKRILALGLALTMSLGMLAGCGGGAKDTKPAANKVYNVGIAQLVEHAALDAANKGFVDGLASKGYKEGQNVKV